MSVGGLLVSLPQMVDLAIGSPEVGAVNFNLLCAALQVIIQQLNLTEHTVDFRGPDVARFQALLATAKPGISVRISEPEDYRRGSVEVDPTKARRSSRPSVNKNKVLIVEPSHGRNMSQIAHVVVGVSQELFTQIHEDVEDLKSKMTEILEIPQNETIMDAVKGKGQEMTPVIDMWQALTVTKRVQAAEEGMQKLAGMFENLIRELGAMSNADGGGVNILADIGTRIDNLENMLQNFEPGAVGMSAQAQTVKGSDDGSHDGDGGGLANDIENLKAKIRAIETDCCALLKGCKGKNFVQLFLDMEELKAKLGDSGEGGEGGQDPAETAAMAAELQEQFSDIQNKFNNLDDMFSSNIGRMQEQLNNIEKELGALTEANNVKPDIITDATSMADLFQKIVKMQEEMNGLTGRLDRLGEDVLEKTLIVETLTEQVEHMKTIKADREDLEDALADKADNILVNRKVSTIQFESACEDLTRHIEDTVKKLTEQEEMWQNTLNELQVTIGGKLDKQEFDPLKDFVNKKIKSLQQRLKALLAMKQEAEAAGTKSKILKNVNCISCDNNVIMYKDNKFPTMPSNPMLPGSRSIKPYITYELDAVRKQQKLIPGSRNMNALESALLEEKQPRKERPSDKALPPGHLCNRYCGGSHTMTLPNQRVAHIGHFLTQWGPQAISLEEGTVLGTDGQMYKAREGGESPKAEKEKQSSRMSAQIQTDSDSKDRVPRMSSTIEPLRRTTRGSKVRSSRDTTQLEPVKEEAQDERKSSKPRRSSAKEGKRSSVVSQQQRPSQTPRTSKGSVSAPARRSSQPQASPPEGAAGEATPAEGDAPAAEAAPAEEAPAEAPAEGAPEGEALAEGEESAPPAPVEAPPGEGEEAPAPGEE